MDDFLQLPFLDEPNILQSLVCEPIAELITVILFVQVYQKSQNMNIERM
jgi:hypothetical protein